MHRDDVVALQISDDEDGSIWAESKVPGMLSSRVHVLDGCQCTCGGIDEEHGNAGAVLIGQIAITSIYL
jgi:hypothetical protein